MILANIGQILNTLTETGIDEERVKSGQGLNPEESASEVKSMLAFMWKEREDRACQLFAMKRLMAIDPTMSPESASPEDTLTHDAVAEQFFQEGGFSHLARVMRDRGEDIEVVVLCLQVLRQMMMTWTSDGNETPSGSRVEAACEAGIADCLITIMEKNSHSPDVLTIVCHALRNLGRAEDTGLTNDLKKRAILIVYKSMKEHEYSEQLQAGACLVLPQLVGVATSGQMKKIMETVMHGLDVHFHSSQMQYQGWRFLGSLQSPSVDNWQIVSVLGQRPLLKLLSQSITRHEEDGELSVTLKRIMERWLSAAAGHAQGDIRRLHELSEMAATARLQSVLPHMERLERAAHEDAHARGEGKEELDRTRSFLHASRARAALSEGNWDRAKEEATACTKAAPHWSQGWLRLGEALDALGDHPQALQRLQHALSLEMEEESRNEIKVAVQLVLDHMAQSFANSLPPQT